MGQIFLVRHGQASLGADNYDELSALGIQQSERLGQYWREMGMRFDAVLCGTLQRHAQTLQGTSKGMGTPLTATPNPGLNEYDADAVIQAIHPAPKPRPTDKESYRQHFQLLREGLLQWAQGTIEPVGMKSWTHFVAGITDALDDARRRHTGNILVISSGGPISIALGQILGLSAQASIELNLQMRNTSVSELRTTASGFRVVSFNTLPHLSGPQYLDWISYA